MKYKVWGKAKVVLKPKKHHFELVLIIAFLALLVAAMVTAVRLGMLYSGTFYSGSTEPYLQMMGSQQVTIRWRSKEMYVGGVEVINPLTKETIINNAQRRSYSQEIKISGLQPDTQYQYRLLHDGEVYRQGKEYFFNTAPESERAVRIWLLGDPGRAGDGLSNVSSSMQQWLEENPRDGLPQLDMVMTTGDNAYDDGTREEFQHNFFTVHQDIFRNVPVWPAYGNHDAKGWSFFRIFSFPENAELGGVASDTPHYYAFNYANIHFIFLDSNEGAFTENDAMLAWLKKDLEKNQQQWTIVVLHHPAYTRGSHNSNSARDSGNRMFNVRKRVLPVLEQAGVDLILAGHSHSYERSNLLDCHYGLSSDFEKSSELQSGEQFIKPLLKKAHSGIVHVVTGSSAEVREGRFDHPALPVSMMSRGSMLLDIDGMQLTARMIDEDGFELDRFVITKSDKITDFPLQTECQQRIYQ